MLIYRVVFMAVLYVQLTAIIVHELSRWFAVWKQIEVFIYIYVFLVKIFSNLAREVQRERIERLFQAHTNKVLQEAYPGYVRVKSIYQFPF
jgi:c-di-AMP phosphodiesterase-like protein